LSPSVLEVAFTSEEDAIIEEKMKIPNTDWGKCDILDKGKENT